MIRPAEYKDISRIAEILIFTKRAAYRPIFHNDKVSFGEMQVLPLAEDYQAKPELLSHIWVYDEEFVKGLITLHTRNSQKIASETADPQTANQQTANVANLQPNLTMLQIEELFVDVFFQNEKIGSRLLSFAETIAREQKNAGMFLWVLEKNEHAREFYRKHGFHPNGDRQLEEGTPEYIVKYEKMLL